MKIYRNGNSVHGLCHMHWQPNKTNSALITFTTLLKRSKATQTFWTLLSPMRELVFCIWSGNKPTKFQIVRSEHAAIQKILILKIRVKTMLILFFDSKDVIHHRYVPEGQTVNAMLYFQVLDYLYKHFGGARPEMRKDWKFFLLYDNARLHAAAIVQQFLAKKGIAQLCHPPYSPDLTPPLFCFPKIKIGAERWPLCCDRRYSEICNRKIKSVPNFWLCESYEMARRSHQTSVFESQETILNKYYLFEFFEIFFHHFRRVVAKLNRHTSYMLIFSYFPCIQIGTLVMIMDIMYTSLFKHIPQLIIDLLVFFWQNSSRLRCMFKGFVIGTKFFMLYLSSVCFFILVVEYLIRGPNTTLIVFKTLLYLDTCCEKFPEALTVPISVLLGVMIRFLLKQAILRLSFFWAAAVFIFHFLIYIGMSASTHYRYVYYISRQFSDLKIFYHPNPKKLH